MYALHAPLSNTALAFDAGQVVLLDHRGPTAARPLTPEAAATWMAAHDLLRLEEADDLTAASLALARQSRRQEALDLALISLDADMPVALRAQAQDELDPLLSDLDTNTWILDVFHARPLPRGADLKTGLTLARDGKRPRVRIWLESIDDRQRVIDGAWSAWNRIPEALFEPAGGRQPFIDAALELGTFAAVARDLAEGRPDKARFTALERLAPLPGYRTVTQAWLHGFAITPRHSVEQRGGIEQEARRAPADRRKKRAHTRYDRGQARADAEKQKAHILRMMTTGRLDRIPELVEDLVTFHRTSGGGEYAAKSLCDLATQAKGLGLHQLQLELTGQARIISAPVWPSHNCVKANGPTSRSRSTGLKTRVSRSRPTSSSFTSMPSATIGRVWSAPPPRCTTRDPRFASS